MVHDTKKLARAHVRETMPRCAQGAEVFVRADIELLYADLHASVWRGLSGVMLPGVTSVAQVPGSRQPPRTLQAERGVVRPPPVGEILDGRSSQPGASLELHLCFDTGRGNWDAVQLIQAMRASSRSAWGAPTRDGPAREPSGDLHLMPYLMQRLIMPTPRGPAHWGVVARHLAWSRRQLRRHIGGGHHWTPAGLQGWPLHAHAPGSSPEHRLHPTDEEIAQAESVLAACAAHGPTAAPCAPGRHGHRCVACRHRGAPHRLGGGVQKTGARQSDSGRADAGDRAAEA